MQWLGNENRGTFWLDLVKELEQIVTSKSQKCVRYRGEEQIWASIGTIIVLYYK